MFSKGKLISTSDMTVNKNMKKVFCACAALLIAGNSFAKLEIEIIKGNASALPIAVVPFQWRASGYPPITAVVIQIGANIFLIVEDFPFLKRNS